MAHIILVFLGPLAYQSRRIEGWRSRSAKRVIDHRPRRSTLATGEVINAALPALAAGDADALCAAQLQQVCDETGMVPRATAI
jgi:hypothetical protein